MKQHIKFDEQQRRAEEFLATRKAKKNRGSPIRKAGHDAAAELKRLENEMLDADEALDEGVDSRHSPKARRNEAYRWQVKDHGAECQCPLCQAAATRALMADAAARPVALRAIQMARTRTSSDYVYCGGKAWTTNKDQVASRREERERMRLERADQLRDRREAKRREAQAHETSEKFGNQKFLADNMRDRMAGARDRKERSDEEKRDFLVQKGKEHDRHVRQLLPYGMRRWETAAKYTKVMTNELSIAHRLGPSYLGPSVAAGANVGSSSNVQGRVQETSTRLKYIFSRGAS